MGPGESGDQALTTAPNPRRTPKRAQSGITWIEFAVVAAVLGVLAGALGVSLLYYEEQAEATVVQLTVRNIRAGLQYQVADRIVQGRARETGQLLLANPFFWLDRPPDDYVGAVRTERIASLPRGSWFYDMQANEFGYVPRLSLHLTVGEGGPKILRWRVRALAAAPSGEAEGLTIVPVSPYKWFWQ